MRSIWILAAAANLIAGHALAQALIPPSHVYSNLPPNAYSSQPPTPLDKNFGLPKAALPAPEAPQQKVPTTTLQDRPDPFAGLSTLARPEGPPAEIPDFFKPSPGMAAPDTQTSDVPNFFERPPEAVLPKLTKTQSSYSTMDTPMFTTDDSSTDDAAANKAALGYTPSEDTTSGDTTTPYRAGAR